MFSQMLSYSACFFQRNGKKIHYLLKPTMNFKHFKIVDPLHQYAIDHFFHVIKIPIDEFQLYYMPLYAAFGN